MRDEAFFGLRFHGPIPMIHILCKELTAFVAASKSLNER
jgi:hypothetical protein